MAHDANLVSRIRAISRDLAKQHRPKGERIDDALRRLDLVAIDIELGVEGTDVDEPAVETTT